MNQLPTSARTLISRVPLLPRFAIAASLNFAISYGAYWWLLTVLRPSIAYFLAFGIGLITGNILHIRFTHRRRLHATNVGIQSGVQVGIGVVASLANGWVSKLIDARLSGLLVIVVCAALSFLASRRLLR